MYVRLQNAKAHLRGGAAMCLSALLLFPILGGTAQALPVTEKPNPASATELIPVGHTIGIKLFSRGILVVGLSEGSTPARECGLKKGDLILKCGGTAATSTEQFQSFIQQSGGKPVSIQIRRNNAVKTLSVSPEKNSEGVWAVGAWIRDSMAGIGTMTFYDPASGVFGALGHGITDTDTAQLMPFSSGSILPSAVKAVKKGEAGAAGELRGDFDLTQDIGELYANTSGGVFGTLAADSVLAENLGSALPVAENSEVRTGKAAILSNVQGDEVREYEIQITKVDAGDVSGRNLVVTVTDPELLKTTGGIVQGMSGSPILQNGKIVGAVTHVLLNDPTRGYGILIRNMLENAEVQAEESVS